MPASGNAADEIHIGDRVAYRFNTGDPADAVRGKVIAIFGTNDGQTLADVEWDTLGPPKRLSITNLAKE
jgi:hypothetical protein